MFIGSTKDLARKFADLRERFGISSFLIDDLDALAPVVEELAGDPETIIVEQEALGNRPACPRPGWV